MPPEKHDRSQLTVLRSHFAVQLFEKQSGRRDLNPRPLDPQECTIPPLPARAGESSGPASAERWTQPQAHHGRGQVRPARRPGARGGRRPRCRWPDRGPAAGRPGGTMRSAATNGPRDRSPIMAAPGKVAETGTAAASSRGGCRTGPPLYWPRMASPPSPRRAEPAFQRTRDAAFRAPRASRAAGSRGLNPAQPSRGRQCRQPGRRNGKANAADDDQPSA